MQILLDAGPSRRGWHFHEAFLKCPQLWAYRYKIAKRSTEKIQDPTLARVLDSSKREPLIKGSLVHIGLAHHYAHRMLRNGDVLQFEDRSISNPDDLLSPADAVTELAERNGSHWVQFESLTHTMLGVYMEHWGDDGGAKPVAVEKELVADVFGSTYSQRIDLAWEDRAGRTWIVDHKTASRVSAGSSKRYTLSGQFLGLQLFGQQIYGEQFGGVLINFLETKPPFRCMRMRPDIAPWALRQFSDSIKWANERMAELEAADTDPWKYPKVMSETVCNTIYGPCDCYELCRWGPRG